MLEHAQRVLGAVLPEEARALDAHRDYVHLATRRSWRYGGNHITLRTKEILARISNVIAFVNLYTQSQKTFFPTTNTISIMACECK